MEKDNDNRLFNKEVRSFIDTVIKKHENNGLVTSHPVSPYGSNDQQRTSLIPSIILWDPLSQLENFPSECNECQLPMKRRSWKDGNNSRDNPRVLYGITQPYLLVSCLYACRKDHKVLSHDQRIIDKCDEQLVPFVLLHQVGATKEFLFYVVSHVTAGLSFQSIEETHSSIWHITSMGIYQSPQDDRTLKIWEPPHTI